MDERVQTLAWILGSGGGCGLLGGLFGGLIGAMHWSSGKATGSFFGLKAAHSLEHVSGETLRPGVKGAIVGGVDGLLFLGLLGTCVGACVLWNTRRAETILVPLMIGLLSLMAGALGFGFLALGILRAGLPALVGVFFAGMLGALLGFYLGGLSGLLAGCLAGVILGTLGSLLFSKRL